MFQLGDLVLVKMGKSLPWPAKIINILQNNRYQVRFYGYFNKAVINGLKITKYNSNTEKLVPESSKRRNMRLYKTFNEIKMEFNSLIPTLESQIKDLEFKLEKCLIKLKSNKFLSIDLSKSNQCEYKQHSLEKTTKYSMEGNDYQAERRLLKDLTQSINDLKQKCETTKTIAVAKSNKKDPPIEKINFRIGDLVMAKKDKGISYWPARIISISSTVIEVYFYIKHYTAGLRNDQIQKLKRLQLKNQSYKPHFAKMLNEIRSDKKVVLSHKEKNLLAALEFKIRKKKRDIKANKKKILIKNRLVDLIENKNVINRTVNEPFYTEDDENSFNGTWCNSESLKQKSEAQSKSKFKCCTIFKAPCPDSLSLKELFA